MLIKLLILIILGLIFWSLGSGLYYLIKYRDDSSKMVKALSLRIGLSFMLFFLLIVAFALGWIQPHDIM